jgi:hypothetical protein
VLIVGVACVKDFFPFKNKYQTNPGDDMSIKFSRVRGSDFTSTFRTTCSLAAEAAEPWRRRWGGRREEEGKDAVWKSNGGGGRPPWGRRIPQACGRRRSRNATGRSGGDLAEAPLPRPGLRPAR